MLKLEAGVIFKPANSKKKCSWTQREFGLCVIFRVSNEKDGFNPRNYFGARQTYSKENRLPINNYISHVFSINVSWYITLFHSVLNGGTVSKLDFRAYNAYTERQKKLFGELSSSAVNTNDTISLGKVADQIRRHRQRDQTIAHVSILAGNRNINACQDTLNLVIRLILMVELGSSEKTSGFMYPAGSRPLPLWDKNSLDSLTEKVFPISLQQSCSGMTMTPEFSAWSLENVAEIKIEFTDNLADHLRLTNNNNQLYIFHHVAFLEAQRHSINSQAPVLPQGLAEETLRTLAILFPQSDHWAALRSNRKKQVWLERLCTHSSRVIDPQLAWCGTPSGESRYLSNFCFWRDRLLILKEDFDHSTPDSFSQWRYDRRNGMQWHNFWVAMVVLGLTAVFGLI
ncbi:uncharacterized protein FOBCDRAFT_197731 [Fusarium oxysporum Fo47]|uniref:uncharacterized protein n=1 Tax=Fusarium oxysporum Fo47 TaxID=660027 RepID=UPI002869E9B4|nr:uncharacterized protein FOBCDRAFT_197731 [Fusarium oxysporum Fo47]QKD50328.2 hypothetical protein FOBCDRAFT_197731 [Fusarium oxysporum Fo47]